MFFWFNITDCDVNFQSLAVRLTWPRHFDFDFYLSDKFHCYLLLMTVNCDIGIVNCILAIDDQLLMIAGMSGHRNPTRNSDRHHSLTTEKTRRPCQLLLYMFSFLAVKWYIWSNSILAYCFVLVLLLFFCFFSDMNAYHSETDDSLLCQPVRAPGF